MTKKCKWRKEYERQKKLGWPAKKKWLQNNPRSRLLALARNNARVKGLRCSLTKDDIIIPDVCPVLGIPLFFTKGKRTVNTPSIDRINNNKGYTKDNIIIVSFRVNHIKGNASIKELVNIGKFYRRYM